MGISCLFHSLDSMGLIIVLRLINWMNSSSIARIIEPVECTSPPRSLAELGKLKPLLGAESARK